MFPLCTGACCFSDGSCQDIDEQSCFELDGTFSGSGTICGVDDECVTPCPTDINGDGVTNVLDLIDLLLCFGQPDTPPCDTGQDVNRDGTVNVLDLIDLLLAFGTTCP